MIRVALRAAAIGFLAWAAVQILLTTQLYATALLVAALAAAVVADPGTRRAGVALQVLLGGAVVNTSRR